ncbi:hypothetical protein FQA39_LY14436 [Lamprigera yunnana]|nr:hypothetical protein FQA39_LY14436 [Lamprigera yunnana]
MIDLSKGLGTNVDCVFLTVRLQKLGFEVKVFKDHEYSQVYSEVVTAANTNHTDSFLMVVLTRGDDFDPTITLNRTETDGDWSNSYRRLTNADFLIAYSTISGYYSWHNTSKGSWFIQASCIELDENYDLLTMLTLVSRRVDFDYESNVPTDAKMHLQ